jgi:hypothetical protein
MYKAIREAVPVESVLAPYTSKSDRRNNLLGVRNGGLETMTDIGAMLTGTLVKISVIG